MKNLTEEQKNYIIQKIQEDKQLPEDFKYLLFPTKQKEYELVYAGKMRKEDLLANEDGIFPVPIQIDKIFNGKEYENSTNNWKNMIVFGDNLQFLKTIYKNEDSLIKDKVKGKVKLIYIDPPFGTGDEYDGNKGQSAYSAKRKGADFVEFLRRRLFLLREILSDKGTIFVRIDYHFGHYVKLLLDEVFGKMNFLNEIIIKRGYVTKSKSNRFLTGTDSLFFYSKTSNHVFNGFEIQRPDKERKWRSLEMPGERKSYEKQVRYFEERPILPPKGQHWGLSQEMIDKLYNKGEIRLNNRVYIDLQGKQQKGILEFLIGKYKKVDSNWTDIQSYSIPASSGYPTENSEQLLERVIESSSDEEDIVLDVFAGSGTTMAAAEKLNRRWIVCDIGKFSYFTMQKRILQIQNSKDLENPKKKYNKKAKSFITCQLGLYDLEKTFDLEWERYKHFIAGLFEIEIKNTKIAGFKFDGKKNEHPVKIFDYRSFKDSSVDENYVEELHKIIGKNKLDRIYIVAPANYTGFLTDYHEIEYTRYYFLKVPYQVIKELHKIPFQKLRQPQSKRNVNDIDETIGFHFIRPPKVKSRIKKEKDKIKIIIEDFRSQYYKGEDGKILENFETLSAIFIDKSYNKTFEMDEVCFADDLLSEEKNKILNIDKAGLGSQIMLIYTDIYGNDFAEIFKI